MDDFVNKHRADGAIQYVKVEAAKVDRSYTGILNAKCGVFGKVTVSIVGADPFTVGFRGKNFRVSGRQTTAGS